MQQAAHRPVVRPRRTGQDDGRAGRSPAAGAEPGAGRLVAPRGHGVAASLAQGWHDRGKRLPAAGADGPPNRGVERFVARETAGCQQDGQDAVGCAMQRQEKRRHAVQDVRGESSWSGTRPALPHRRSSA
jgi:hypothetical protein